MVFSKITLPDGCNFTGILLVGGAFRRFILESWAVVFGQDGSVRSWSMIERVQPIRLTSPRYSVASEMNLNDPNCGSGDTDI